MSWASHFSIQFHPWIKSKNTRIKRKWSPTEKLLIVKQILMVNTLKNIWRTWQGICILMLDYKGLNFLWNFFRLENLRWRMVNDIYKQYFWAHCTDDNPKAKKFISHCTHIFVIFEFLMYNRKLYEGKCTLVFWKYFKISQA